MKPPVKSEGMEQAIKDVFGTDRREAIKSDKCVAPPIGCGGDATEFRDELSRREFSISGLCQKCQDKVWKPKRMARKKAPAEPAIVVGPNDWVSDGYQMFYGQADAAERRYHKHIGKSGRIWLVADQENAAENIYVANNPENTTHRSQGSEGFGGATLHFTLVDGTTVDLHGPWHTNADSLFADTGVDVRNQTFTFVVLGADRQVDWEHGMRFIIRDVVYKDEKPVLGAYDRYKDVIKAHPEAKVYYMTSRGGSSCGQITDADRA